MIKYSSWIPGLKLCIMFSVERSSKIEETEHLWVIKIIPADPTTKPKHFALPSEKDLHVSYNICGFSFVLLNYTQSKPFC